MQFEFLNDDDNGDARGHIHDTTERNLRNDDPFHIVDLHRAVREKGGTFILSECHLR
jgi:hypothetical protein